MPFEEPTGLPATAVAVYSPFPDFETWSTQPYDEHLFDMYVEQLQAAKASSTSESLAAALETATRAAAVDTGAIEGLYQVDRGFTMTVAGQAAAWEQLVAARGDNVRRSIEDALNAYEYVMDACTKSTEIGEVWLRELHSIICRSQETYTVYTAVGPQQHVLPKGEYKSMPNSPHLPTGKQHAYAPVLDTRPEMERLVAELRSDAFMAATPIQQAAYAHYAFVCVHPFADGNGRVARALASVYLYRHPGVPLVVFADQKGEYFDALEAADQGDSEPFIAFIAARALDTIGLVKASLRRSGPPINQSMAAITSYFSVGGVEDDLLLGLARLRDVLVRESQTQIRALGVPPALTVAASPVSLGVVVPEKDGYVTPGDRGVLRLTARSKWPMKIQSTRPLAVQMRASAESRSDYLLVSNDPGDDGVECWLRELQPVLSETLKIKAAAWCETQLGELLADVARQMTGTE